MGGWWWVTSRGCRDTIVCSRRALTACIHAVPQKLLGMMLYAGVCVCVCEVVERTRVVVIHHQLELTCQLESVGGLLVRVCTSPCGWVQLQGLNSSSFGQNVVQFLFIFTQTQSKYKPKKDRLFTLRRLIS